MTIGARTTQEWARWLAAHMPQGALDLSLSSTFHLHFRGLAAELARTDALLEQLGPELDPSTTASLLTDWLEEMELPRCDGDLPATSSLRRAIVVSLLTRSPDLSPATLIAAAAVIGFTISIVEYPDGPNAFSYTATVEAGTLEVVPFEAGLSGAGDFLGTVEQSDLACLLDEIEPAYATRELIGA